MKIDDKHLIFVYISVEPWANNENKVTVIILRLWKVRFVILNLKLTPSVISSSALHQPSRQDTLYGDLF